MNITGVRMSCNDNLEPVTPEFFRKLYSDSMGFIRRSLIFLETLVGMEGYYAVSFAKPYLGRVELVTRKLNAAVDARCVIQFLGLIFVRRMFVKTTYQILGNPLRCSALLLYASVL